MSQKKCNISYPAVISWSRKGLITIGDETYVGPYSEIVAVSNEKDQTAQAVICIGNNCKLGAFANIRGGRNLILIGDNVLIGQHVTIVSNNHDYTELTKAHPEHNKYKDEDTDIRIEDNVWIGSGSIVLPGSVVEKGSVIGANSIVNCHIPANQLWAGIPASFKKALK